jgi:hypothetical protein
MAQASGRKHSPQQLMSPQGTLNHEKAQLTAETAGKEHFEFG